MRPRFEEGRINARTRSRYDSYARGQPRLITSAAEGALHIPPRVVDLGFGGAGGRVGGDAFGEAGLQLSQRGGVGCRPCRHGLQKNGEGLLHVAELLGEIGVGRFPVVLAPSELELERRGRGKNLPSRTFPSFGFDKDALVSTQPTPLAWCFLCFLAFRLCAGARRRVQPAVLHRKPERREHSLNFLQAKQALLVLGPSSTSLAAVVAAADPAPPAPFDLIFLACLERLPSGSSSSSSPCTGISILSLRDRFVAVESTACGESETRLLLPLVVPLVVEVDGMLTGKKGEGTTTSDCFLTCYRRRGRRVRRRS